MKYCTAKEFELIPQEETCANHQNKNGITIAMPKENPQKETRVPLTPMGVSVLTASGYKVIVESGAGQQANYSDLEYSEAGATITDNRQTIFGSQMVIKIAPCSQEEIGLMKKGGTILSFLEAAIQKKEYITALQHKKILAVALEYIKTEKDFYPVMYANSEIAGRNAIIVAAEYLGKQRGGKGVLLGGITGISPASVVIFGTGTAALYAARTAINLGAEVKIFDNSVYNLLCFTQKLNRDIFTSVMHPKVIQKALASADVVIGAKSIKAHPYPVITQEMVAKMKKGSVIVDLNVEIGSCFETSAPSGFDNPAFEKNGIIHYCLPNITALVPRTASIALSNVLYPLLLSIRNSGLNQEIKYNPGLRNGIYTFNGILTNEYLGKKFNIPHKDINLFLNTL